MSLKHDNYINPLHKKGIINKKGKIKMIRYASKQISLAKRNRPIKKTGKKNSFAGVSVNQRDKNGLNVLAKAAESDSKRQRLEGKISETNGSAGVSVNQRDKNRLNMLLKAAESVSKRQRLKGPKPKQKKVSFSAEVPLSVVKDLTFSNGTQVKNFQRYSDGSQKVKVLILPNGNRF